MWLQQVKVIGRQGLADIRVAEGKIESLVPEGSSPVQRGEPAIACGGALAFPGLINSHDHLDFNLFPRLGNRVYRNYTEWGKDIHAVNRAAIAEVLRIPRPLRVQWGIYKNLLNGITTVVDHGKPLPASAGELITVIRNTRCLHSPAFERRWKWKINLPAFGRPVVMHLGEGTDDLAGREIDRVIRWNLLRNKLVAVHGVAMQERQAPAFQALVWCPASNHFLLNRTAAIDRLDPAMPIVFGTDSTLTAHWNLWEHLRLARAQKMVPGEVLLDMLSRRPAKLWGLSQAGRIGAGYAADLVLARATAGADEMDGFYALNPEDHLLILHQGHVRSFDAGLLEPLREAGFSCTGLSRIRINGNIKYVQGDLPALMQQIRRHHPAADFPVSAG
jgi:cytosine/adenosine deaminase-related metal-dependent hydrolase